jgi:hypothetical protein
MRCNLSASGHFFFRAAARFPRAACRPGLCGRPGAGSDAERVRAAAPGGLHPHPALRGVPGRFRHGLSLDRPGWMAAHYTASQEARMFLTGIGANHRNLVQSPVATGTVGFARGAWSGIGQRTGKAFEGIVYISVTPSRYIEIQSHDAAPYSRSTCRCSAPPPSPSASCDARHEERLDDRAGEEAVQEKCPPRCGRAFVLGRLQLLRRQFQDQRFLGIKRRFDAVETPPSSPNRPPILYNKAFEPVLTEQERHLAADPKTPVSLRFCWSAHRYDSFTTAKRLRER